MSYTNQSTFLVNITSKITKFPNFTTFIRYIICPYPHQYHNSDNHVNGRPRLEATLAAFSRMPANSLQILPIHYS